MEKSPNPFSATDHDPVMIDLSYSKAQAQKATTTAYANSDKAGSLGIFGLAAMGILGLVFRRK